MGPRMRSPSGDRACEAVWRRLIGESSPALATKVLVRSKLWCE